MEEQSVIYTGRRYGDNASLNCDPGHEPEGSHQISCRSDGNWSGDIGKCKVKGKCISTLECVSKDLKTTKVINIVNTRHISHDKLYLSDILIMSFIIFLQSLHIVSMYSDCNI